ncbi:MAG TPA: Uma2 family endonuclease [Blastocatellia bacterium]|jgi:Uma2 family endonuclease|nr:Uma2 family endonuclease [Blastocatellia bacterium]
MSTAQRHINPESRPYRWTREEYYKIGEIGFFEDKRVELIEGEVIEMSPIYSPHATSVTLAGDVLRAIFDKGWVVREEKPLSLGDDSDPEPDIALVEGKARDFKDAHPTTAALVIEVADSSLSYDRSRKACLYAKSGILDYWILNLQDRQIEVHRRPIADAASEFGFSYGDKMIFKEDDSVRPIARPDVSIAVADLLP